MTKRIPGVAALGAAIVSAMMFASCENGDDNVAPTDALIASQITGKWKRLIWSAESEYTNERTILTFDGDGSGYASFTYMDADSNRVVCSGEMGYSVHNSTLRYKIPEYQEDSLVCPVLYINDSTFTTQTTDSDGKTVLGYSIYKKVTNDFSEKIPGTWQGKVETDTMTLDYRLKFLSSGAMEYYTMDSDSTWAKGSQTDLHYIIDGDWLAVTYKTAEDGITLCDCWDILSLTDNSMRMSQYTLVGTEKKSRTTQLTKVTSIQ